MSSSTELTTYPGISDSLWSRIRASGLNALSNDTIHSIIEEGDLDSLQLEVQDKFQKVLDALLIDTQNDHNSKDTAKRWAKMMIHELYRGRYYAPPEITEFPNVTKVDELFVVGPVQLRSACAHHMVPITGQVWVGVLAKETLIGLSKFHRTIDHLGSRPQIQEELAMQIADALWELTDPMGLAVLIRAHHQCCSHRGVKDNNSMMMSSVTRGALRTNPSTKDEFFRLVDLSLRS